MSKYIVMPNMKIKSGTESSIKYTPETQKHKHKHKLPVTKLESINLLNFLSKTIKTKATVSKDGQNSDS